MGGNAFANAFVPPVYPRLCNRFNRGCANQALLGWHGPGPIANARVRADEMFSLFQAGWTAHEVREEIARMADAARPPQDVLRLWGDFDMRLHGVYTGSTLEAPNDWFCDFYSLE